MNRLNVWWGTFTYNFAWSDWVEYVDGWVPRFSFFFPLVGYMILFNDQISAIVQFKTITHQSTYAWGLSAAARLHFIYYALFFLGVSNFLYRFKKPYVFRFGKDSVEYTRTAFESFTFQDYLDIHSTIRQKGAWTTQGKYYDTEWEGFVIAARNQGEGTGAVTRTGNWEDAKNKYGSLLRSMLRENFFQGDTRGRVWLSCCILLSTIGYGLLIVPSLDLFAKVTFSIFLL
jgi:hypothetical protein